MEAILSTNKASRHIKVINKTLLSVKCRDHVEHEMGNQEI